MYYNMYNMYIVHDTYRVCSRNTWAHLDISVAQVVAPTPRCIAWSIGSSTPADLWQSAIRANGSSWAEPVALGDALGIRIRTDPGHVQNMFRRR